MHQCKIRKRYIILDLEHLHRALSVLKIINFFTLQGKGYDFKFLELETPRFNCQNIEHWMVNSYYSIVLAGEKIPSFRLIQIITSVWR